MRGLRISVIIAVVLGILFVAADRIAVGMAESKTAERIRAGQGLKSTPEVSIKGFPFLTQVMDRRLDEVEVRLAGLTAAAGGHQVEVTEVRATLRDVKVNSGYTSAVAGGAEGSARISYEDLSRAAPQGATVGYAGPERAARGQVKVTGPLLDVLKGAGVDVPRTFEPLLRSQATIYSTVSLKEGATVQLKADSLPGIPLPGFDRRLREIVDYDLKIEDVPPSLRLNRVEATPEGLRFTGRGTDVNLVG
jgi:hypothetical protein